MGPWYVFSFHPMYTIFYNSFTTNVNARSCKAGIRGDESGPNNMTSIVWPMVGFFHLLLL